MKRKSEIESMYNRLTEIAPKAGSTLRTVEAYTAIKAIRWVLERDPADNNLEEIIECIESETEPR